MWVTKKTLKAEVADLKQQLSETTAEVNELKNAFPLKLNQVVYDLQLRNTKGRFTKTKATREYSFINEVVVDKKNYFNLVNRYASNDVFTDKDAAEKYLESVCVE